MIYRTGISSMRKVRDMEREKTVCDLILIYMLFVDKMDHYYYYVYCNNVAGI